MENIPVFGEVEKKRALYTPLKEKYDAAVEADKKAQEAFTTATNNYNTYKDGDYKTAEDAVNNFSGEKEYTKNVWVARKDAEPFKEFAVFNKAAYNRPTEDLDEKMWWGYYNGRTYRYIVFVKDDIKEKIRTSTINPVGSTVSIIGSNIAWCSEPITPINIYYDEEHPENSPEYETLLEGLTLSEGGTAYSPQYCVFYYEEPNVSVDETSEDYGKMVLKAMQYKLDGVTSAFMAFTQAYDNIKRVIYDSVETTETTKEYQNVLDALADAERTLADYEQKKTDAENDAATKAGELEAAQKAKDDAVKAFNDVAEAIALDDPAKKDDEGLIICEPRYTTISVTNSFKITDSDYKDVIGATQTSLWNEWYEGYTLEGNGYCINSARALFRTNYGTIENLANTDGAIASSNKGDVFYCLTRRNATTVRAYHSNDDTDNYENVDIETIIYQVGGSGFLFGYDAETGTILPLTDETKLYAAQYSNAGHKDVYEFKLNIKEGQPKWNKENFESQFGSNEIADNSILYIDESSAKSLVEKNEMENVAVKVGGVYTCYNTVLKDGRKEDGSYVEEFYIPNDFTSKKLTYNRELTQKISAVCLPFRLNDNTKTMLGYNDTFQFSNVDTSTGVMWFTTRTIIEPNQPCLISLSDDVENRNIFAEIKADLGFKATPSKLVAESANGEEFFGTYVSATADDLTANKGEAVYGIQDGWLKKANSTARIHQFRSYVKRPNTVAANEAPSYQIGLMDEDGNELSTAIETVTGEIISGFKAKGGDNAIEVSTDEVCQVKVYTLSGALVKSTRVEVGVTSLPVKAGIYVVNGVKVIVK